MKKTIWKWACLIGVAVLLSGCSFMGLSFGQNREEKLSGQTEKKSLEGNATYLTVERISLLNQKTQVKLCRDGGAARVEIEAPSDLMDRISVSFSGKQLKIQGPSGVSFTSPAPVGITLYNNDFTTLIFAGACHAESEIDLGKAGEKLSIRLSGASSLTAPSLSGSEITLDMSGASNLHTKALSSNKLKIDLTGASRAALEKAQVSEDCDWHISGASTLLADGKGSSIFAVIAGASKVQARDFELTKTILTVSGASTLECFVTESLGGSISGSSHIYYRGDPELATSVTGVSTVEKISD